MTFPATNFADRNTGELRGAKIDEIKAYAAEHGVSCRTDSEDPQIQRLYRELDGIKVENR